MAATSPVSAKANNLQKSIWFIRRLITLDMPKKSFNFSRVAAKCQEEHPSACRPLQHEQIHMSDVGDGNSIQNCVCHVSNKIQRELKKWNHCTLQQ